MTQLSSSVLLFFFFFANIFTLKMNLKLHSTECDYILQPAYYTWVLAKILSQSVCQLPCELDYSYTLLYYISELCFTTMTGVCVCQSALLMFELAWKMSKDSNDVLWLAIIGVTDQYVHYKVAREKYIDDVMALQSHVSRLNRK